MKKCGIFKIHFEFPHFYIGICLRSAKFAASSHRMKNQQVTERNLYNPPNEKSTIHRIDLKKLKCRSKIPWVDRVLQNERALLLSLRNANNLHQKLQFPTASAGKLFRFLSEISLIPAAPCPDNLPFRLRIKLRRDMQTTPIFGRTQTTITNRERCIIPGKMPDRP